MSSITTRAAKGSALTHAEVDANFTNLNSGKAEVSGQTFTGAVVLPAGSATAGGVQVGTGATYKPSIYSPSADQLAISTGGSERARLDSSGRLLVGTSTARANFFNTSNTVAAQIEGTGYQTASLALISTGSASFHQGTLVLAKGRGNSNGSNTIVQSDDTTGYISFQGNDGSEFVECAVIKAEVDGAPGANDMPGRLVFSTTSDGAASPTERMRITNDGSVLVGGTNNGFNAKFIAIGGSNVGDCSAGFGGINAGSSTFYHADVGGANAANAVAKFLKVGATGRSINAAGTVNASGADYAEYMVKAGNFTIAKGDVCGVTANGQLTNNFADAASFVVKSTNPSYVGGDTWGSEDALGPKPDAENTEALAQWKADLEIARQQVDRIAFAGQVPVNVMGATPGQYIVPAVAASSGIKGVAKNESDLTLIEYMQAVGKVIAIEDDGRARIIVKVA